MHIKPTKKILKSLFVLSLFLSISAEAAIDNCLVGKWQPDAAQLKQQFEYITKQKITSLAGQLVMDLGKDAKGIYQLNNFSMTTVIANAAETTIVMNGKSNFDWSTASKKFSMKGGKFVVKVTGWMKMGGTKIPLPEMPFNESQFPSEFADGSYTCTDEKLVFTLPSEDKLLRVWHKI